MIDDIGAEGTGKIDYNQFKKIMNNMPVRDPMISLSLAFSLSLSCSPSFSLYRSLSRSLSFSHARAVSLFLFLSHSFFVSLSLFVCFFSLFVSLPPLTLSFSLRCHFSLALSLVLCDSFFSLYLLFFVSLVPLSVTLSSSHFLLRSRCLELCLRCVLVKM